MVRVAVVTATTPTTETAAVATTKTPVIDIRKHWKTKTFRTFLFVIFADICDQRFHIF